MVVEGDLFEEMIAGVKGELSAFFESKAASNPDESDPSAVLLTKVCQVIRDVGMRMEMSRRLDQGDFAVQLAPLCARAKTNPVQGAKAIAEALQASLASLSATEAATRLVKSVAAAGPYLNVSLNRPLVYKRVVEAVASRGAEYGVTDLWKGKRVIVEHTSSNPNAPLHIGNLRNVMIGAHAARLIQSVGAEVKQHFYVNDLGAQIGLTAFGYHRVYNKIKPTMKIDHWIGSMYAIMNTLVELQKVSEPRRGAPRSSGNRAIFLLPSPPPPPQPPHVSNSIYLSFVMYPLTKPTTLCRWRWISASLRTPARLGTQRRTP